MRKKLKGLFSIITCMLILATSINFSYAETNAIIDSKNVNISQLNGNSLLVTSEDERAVIRVSTNGNVTRTDVYDLETGEDYYFVSNNKTNTVYSSLTGKTIRIENSVTENIQENSFISMFRSVAKGDKYIKTVRISTRTLSNLMSVVSVASLIAAVVASGGGAVVIPALRYFLTGATSVGISLLLTNNDYLVWDIYEVDTSTVKGGKRYYYRTEKVKNLRFE